VAGRRLEYDKNQPFGSEEKSKFTPGKIAGKTRSVE